MDSVQNLEPCLFYTHKELLQKGLKFNAYRDIVPPNAGCLPHKHDFIELVYMISGSATHYVDGIAYPMLKGDLLFIDIDQSHSFSTQTETTFANMILLPEFLMDNLHADHTALDVFAYLIYKQEDQKKDISCSQLIRLHGKALIMADMVVNSICDELYSKESNYKEVAASYMSIFFYLIIRSIENNSTAPLMHDIRNVLPDIIEYIEHNCGKQITLNDLAEQYFYSPSYFSRAFKRILGTTFSAYLQNVRVQKIIHLMEDPTLSLDDISETVGYSDKRELYRIFKNITGTTPSKYRHNKITWK